MDQLEILHKHMSKYFIKEVHFLRQRKPWFRNFLYVQLLHGARFILKLIKLC